MSLTYKYYPNSNYIVLSDGKVARLLKETKIHNQTYYNLIIDKKMKRTNTQVFVKMFDSNNGVQA